MRNIQEKFNIHWVWVLLCYTILSYACSKSDSPEDEDTTVLIALNHNAVQSSGCLPAEGPLRFLISSKEYFQEFIIIEGKEIFITPRLKDKEVLTTTVYRHSDGTKLAESSIPVRTKSRPTNLENTTRRIIYCTAFNLIFENF